jgi:ubiquinone/menaquinone biosynthesis C-methylase UbiE
MATDQKILVRDYWEAQPCGSDDAESPWASRKFFAEIEQERYQAEPFVRDFAAFQSWKGKQVLEVGVGAGTDFVNFARAGAEATGIDLTENGISLARHRLSLEGLTATLRVADAEALPFEDASFDLVYSWGVLHHTPDTEKAISEVHRVLAPGGEARIMLYARRSWKGIRMWLHYALLRGRPFQSLATVIGEHLESAGTKAYTQSELEDLFAGFSSVRMTRFLTPYDTQGFGPIARLTGSRFGFFVGIVAKP